MIRYLAVLIFTGTVSYAQSICPSVNFMVPRAINLNTSASSHLTLLRQSDGSYTAFEMANASPYAILRTFPHFEKQFAACLPRPIPGTSTQTGQAANSSVAQKAITATLGDGDYLFASINGNSVDVKIFSHNLALISEEQVAVLAHGTPPPEGTGQYLSILLTDVNGDGKLDLIAQYEFIQQGEASGGGGVNILLGDGIGGFQQVSSLPLNGAVVNGSMAAGDLNGDGKPDLAIGAAAGPFDNSSGALVVAFGDGHGNFTSTTVPTPGVDGPGAIAIADFNKDGKNDIAFLTSAMVPNVHITNQLAVMLGHGDGTFGAISTYNVQVAAPGSVVTDTDSSPGALAIGDINEDGFLDVVTNGITILLGDGKGGFPDRRDFLNLTREGIVLADIDADGKLDVAVGNGGPLAFTPLLYPDEHSLTVYFGDGMGSLLGPPVGDLPTSNPSAFDTYGDLDAVAFAAADFNGDGVSDLAAIRNYQSLSVFLGDKSRLLKPAFSYNFATIALDASPASVVAADFNQDGIVDLAVSVSRLSGNPGSILVFLGAGDGTFLPPVSTVAPAYLPSLIAGDFNKDGRMDLAALDGDPNDTRLDIFAGNGDGTFTAAQSYPVPTSTGPLAGGDFNGDGALDIVTPTSFANTKVFLGKGDGSFTPAADIPFRSAGDLRAADFNRDGKLDLVSGTSILLGRGDGSFDAPVSYSNGQPPIVYADGPSGNTGAGSVAIGDIDGDGILDIFLDSGNVLIGNGDGTFHLQTTTLGSSFTPVILGDFDGDGELDAAGAFSMSVDPGMPFRRGAAVFFNASSPGPQLEVVSAADFSFVPMTPNSIASAFGKDLATGVASAPGAAPVETLAGTTVSIEDQSGAVRTAQLFYASPTQVNFLIPSDLQAGPATVRILSADGTAATSIIQLVPTAPRFFVVNGNGVPAGYIVRVAADGTQKQEPIFSVQSGSIQLTPIDLSTGDVYLILYGTGFDVFPNAKLEFYGSGISPADLSPSYAGPQKQIPGLDQLNVLLPKSFAGAGLTSINLSPGTVNNIFIDIK